MNPLRLNNKGIALVTSLMLTLLSLVMCTALLYFVTIGTKVSASQMRYKTALEAANGGTELLLKDILPSVLQGYSSSISAKFSTLSMQVSSGPCFQQKLTSSPSAWSASCNSVLNAKSQPDLTFNLKSVMNGFTKQPDFRVYSKIVDTVAGNTDISGVQLEGSGAAEQSGAITPKTIPYYYRIEVLSERASNSNEKATLSVLYAN